MSACSHFDELVFGSEGLGLSLLRVDSSCADADALHLPRVNLPASTHAEATVPATEAGHGPVKPGAFGGAAQAGKWANPTPGGTGKGAGRGRMPSGGSRVSGARPLASRGPGRVQHRRRLMMPESEVSEEDELDDEPIDDEPTPAPTQKKHKGKRKKPRRDPHRGADVAAVNISTTSNASTASVPLNASVAAAAWPGRRPATGRWSDYAASAPTSPRLLIHNSSLQQQVNCTEGLQDRVGIHAAGASPIGANGSLAAALANMSAVGHAGAPACGRCPHRRRRTDGCVQVYGRQCCLLRPQPIQSALLRCIRCQRHRRSHCRSALVGSQGARGAH